MTNKRRKRRGPSVAAIAPRVARLRMKNVRVADIAVRLDVSERQVYRAMKSAQKQDLYADFEPWTLLTAMADDDPGEKTRCLLERKLLLTRGLARYAWAVVQAKPQLGAEITEVLAAEYWGVDTYERDPADKTAMAGILDLALAMEPWLHERAQNRFYEAAVRFVPRHALVDQDDVHGDVESARQRLEFIKRLALQLWLAYERSRRGETFDLLGLRSQERPPDPYLKYLRSEPSGDEWRQAVAPFMEGLEEVDEQEFERLLDERGQSERGES